MAFSLGGVKGSIVKCAVKLGTKIKGASPKILVVAGVCGMVGAGVLACKETLKLDEVIDPARADLDRIRDAVDGKIELKDGATYTAEDAKKDRFTVYKKATFKTIKNYAPSILLAILSIIAILSGMKILNKRHLAAIAAYSGLSETFDTYRARVADKYGKEAEKIIFSGGEQKLITDETVDTESGEVKRETKDETVTRRQNLNLNDPRTAIFDANTAVGVWSRSPGYNYTYLVQVQQNMNDKLRSRGVLEINDILEEIGLEYNEDAIGLGWVDNADHTVYVDFGITRLEDDADSVISPPDFALYFNAPGYIKDAFKKEKARRHGQCA